CSLVLSAMSISIFFFNVTATTEIYTLSLHDALPIYMIGDLIGASALKMKTALVLSGKIKDENEVLPTLKKEEYPTYIGQNMQSRSEEHTSELQSRENLVCRLLLEKKKKQIAG